MSEPHYKVVVPGKMKVDPAVLERLNSEYKPPR